MQEITQTAKSISDLGMLVMVGAVYLVATVVLFRWFRSIITQVLQEYRQNIQSLLQETRTQNDMLNDISEGLRTETQLRIRNLSGFAFDLAVENVCRLIKRVREENHIADKKNTADKIRKALKVIHDDRNSRFDTFTYRGRVLSDYCNPDWIEQVAKVVEAEIYNQDGPNNGRAYTNVHLAYDNIKTDFYKRLNGMTTMPNQLV